MAKFNYIAGTIYHETLDDARTAVKTATEIFPHQDARIYRVADQELVEVWRYDDDRRKWTVKREEDNDEHGD